MSNQKGFIKILLLIIAIIALALFVYIKMSYRTEVILSNNAGNETSGSFQSSEKDTTADWETFTKYGFEFKYPAEWIVKDLETLRYWFILTDDTSRFLPGRISPKNSLSMNFSLMDNTVNKYTIDYLAGCINSEARVILECEDLNINEVSYKKVIAKRSSSEVGGLPVTLDQKYIKVVTVFDNKSLVVSATLDNPSSVNEKVVFDKFDSILQTFKFSKQ